jgi:hypothetical protein
VTLNSLNIILKTERYLKESSLFTINLSGLDVKKLKQKSSVYLHSFAFALGEFSMGFQNMDDSSPQKMLGLTRIIRAGRPVPCEIGLRISIDILKEDRNKKKKTAIRADIASIQSVLTLSSSLELLKVAEKLDSFAHRKMFLQPDLLQALERSKLKETVKIDLRSGAEGLLNGQDDEKFMSCKPMNNMMASFMQSMVGDVKDNLRQPTNTQQTAQDDGAKQLSTQSVVMDFKESELDFTAAFQGLYLAFLKEPLFQTDKVFSWIKTLSAGQRLEFQDLMYSYFLLRVEDIRVVLGPTGISKNVEIGAIDIVDFIYLQSDEPNLKHSKASDSSFQARVEIEGLDNDIGDSSLNSSSLIEPMDSMADFKSMVDMSDFNYNKYKRVVMLEFQPLIQIDATAQRSVMDISLANLTNVPEVGINIAAINVNFEIDSFVLLKNRKGFSEQILKSSINITSERNKCQEPSFRKQEAVVLYEGLEQRGAQNYLKEVSQIVKLLEEKEIKWKLMRLFDIVDSSKSIASECPKITINITRLNIKIGGVLDSVANTSAWLEITADSLHISINKLMMITWKRHIDFMLNSGMKKNKVMSILCEKENLIAIEDPRTIIKISAIEVNFGPEIFEQIMCLMQIVETKLLRYEYTTKKFKILDMIVNFREVQRRSYILYEEELQINSKVAEIARIVYSPDEEKPQKVSFYLGRVSLKLFDEDITTEMIKSLNDQNLKFQANLKELDEWHCLADNNQTSSISEKLREDVKRMESTMSNAKAVLHLEIKCIFAVFKTLKDKMELIALVNTVMIMDGWTYQSFLDNKSPSKDKDQYKTHFFELYSIDCDQPTYDAYAGKNFNMEEADNHFKRYYKTFEKKNPFINIKMSTKNDFIPSKKGDKVDRFQAVTNLTVEVSSIAFRFAMHTSREMFTYLIRIIDDALARLQSFQERAAKLNKENDTEEMKNFKKRKAEIETQLEQAPKPQSESHTKINVKLNAIYLDFFYQNNYRLLFKVEETKVDISEDQTLGNPISVQVKNIQGAMTNDNVQISTKLTDKMDNNKLYFKLFSLQLLKINIDQEVGAKIPTTVTTVQLPTLEGKNVILVFDIESLSIIIDILKTIDNLMQHARRKTKCLFKDFTEYISKPPQSAKNEGAQDFEAIGFKYQEYLNLKTEFQQLSDTYLNTKTELIDMKEGDIAKSEVIFAANPAQTQNPGLDSPRNSPQDQSAFKISPETSSEVIEKRFRIAKSIIDDPFIQNIGQPQNISILRVLLEKITINIYQKFDLQSHSYVKVKIMDSLMVMKNISSSEQTNRGPNSVTNSSLIFSVRSLRVLDHTTNSMFKYLVKIPKHSLCCFVRFREFSEKYTKNQDELLTKTTYVVETYKDKIGLIVELKPLMLFIDDKSVKSLMDFSKQLLDIMKPSQSNSTLATTTTLTNTESSLEPDRAEERFMIDYLAVSPLSLQLTSRSSTNLSLANFLPDININLEVELI